MSSIIGTLLCLAALIFMFFAGMFAEDEKEKDRKKLVTIGCLLAVACMTLGAWLT